VDGTENGKGDGGILDLGLKDSAGLSYALPGMSVDMKFRSRRFDR
jgi:hypothetical protein